VTVSAHVPVAGHPAEDVQVVGGRQRTGVLLLIVADAAFVGALVFSYFYLRGLNTSGAWITQGMHTATIWVGWLIGLIAVASAWCYRSGVNALRTGKIGGLIGGAGIALALVLLDSVVQIIQLASLPFKPDANAYASCVYTLAGANLFHLLLTAVIGVGIWNRARLGRYVATNPWQVEIVAIWWNWIAVAAIAGAVTTSFIASPNVGG
jgi:heme/copper-type cytochrome/quinol oxidase subunit 3